jgi:hypothetical protein
VVAHAAARRLSRVEYEHTVRDLLGLPADKAVASALPTDESVAGYATNSVAPPTAALAETYFAVAEGLVAAADLRRLAACADTPADAAWGTDTCARTFVRAFLRRAFRRPPTQAEIARHMAVFASKRRSGSPDPFSDGLRLVVTAALSSPSFLYRGVPPASGRSGTPALVPPFDLATRLAYFLWSSGPDDRLLDLAQQGGLGTGAAVEAEARRMLADPRAVDAWRSFHRQWLGLQHMPDKSKRTYPEWGDGLWRSMQRELDLFVEHVYGTGSHTLPELLLSRTTFVDEKLAPIYGVAPPPGPGFWRVDLPGGERGGVFTRAAFLTANAFPDQASPIHRGKFVRENLLCQIVPEPPNGLDLTPPKVDPKKPTKERYEDHRLQGLCSRCHRMMDPLGFAFQHYDGVGRWQTRDGEHPVDAVGEIEFAGPLDGEVKGALALGDRLTGSAEVQRCVARQWIRFALGRMDHPGEACLVDQIQARFASANLDLHELLVAIAGSDLMRLRGVVTAAPQDVAHAP